MVRVCIGGVCRLCLVFFFKQKTAYEMLRSLVGSEMCIRDSPASPWIHIETVVETPWTYSWIIPDDLIFGAEYIAVSYTHLTLPTIYSV